MELGIIVSAGSKTRQGTPFLCWRSMYKPHYSKGKVLVFSLERLYPYPWQGTQAHINRLLIKIFAKNNLRIP